MADQPPKRPQKNPHPTLVGTGQPQQPPRTTAPMPTTVEPPQRQRHPTPVKPADMPKDDEWTRAMDGSEPPRQKPKAKFVDLDDPSAATAISGLTHNAPPARTAAGEAMGGTTLKDMPAQRATLRDVPTATPPASLKDMPVHTAATVREPSLDLPVVVEQLAQMQIAEPTADVPKAKVWVATHRVPPDPDARLIMVLEPDSSRAASFRVLRHRLAERGDPRVIVVSSAEPKEGKSTTAANLSLALGECGRARVLLLEANLRAPSLAALFGFLPPECFSTQLARHREKPLDPWSVVEVFSPSLHVCAVKPGPDSENRPLLDGVALGIAVDMLRRSGYDYVVIDTPPVLGSADVNLVEDYCDGVLLTTWSRRSSQRALRHAMEQLSPQKILGITLLDV
jgi:Mrp family chromosome partitioning ATPase